MLSLSQDKLGEAIGLTFQQVQKYERGTNRIGASRLLEIAQVLRVPIAFFYDDVDPVRAPPVEAEGNAPEGDLMRQPETIELVTNYYGIADSLVRRRLFALAKVPARGINDMSPKQAIATPRRRGRPARA